MAKVVVLGAGVAGHTAVSFLKQRLGKKHEVIVVTPNSKYNWIPSNIWVGVGIMKPEDVTFELAPVYKKKNITYKQARAVDIHPEGGADEANPYVTIEYTEEGRSGETENVAYDYLINATGPKLNFSATPGLGPEGNSHSVCTWGHAVDAAVALKVSIEKMKKGERQKFLIGTGHGMATCQGAAFEYLFNIESELRQHGVRDMADMTWISNEYELGDFGMGGMHLKRGGYITHSKVFTESLFTERGVRWITRAHVIGVDPGKVCYETLTGEDYEEEFDFAMLIPPFSGVGLKGIDKSGQEITGDMFNPAGFMFVDGNYTAKPYEEWDAADWPRNYQSKGYPNIFAAGIAFAPPHPISKPMKSPAGTPIFPTPPRTGMPSAMIGKAVAMSIADMLEGAKETTHTASMAEMGAACVASAGAGFFKGTAVSMTVFPIIPDYTRFPVYGRDMDYTTGEIGLAGHWIKYILHRLFIWKAKLKFGWSLIPE